MTTLQRRSIGATKGSGNGNGNGTASLYGSSYVGSPTKSPATSNSNTKTNMNMNMNMKTSVKIRNRLIFGKRRRKIDRIIVPLVVILLILGSFSVMIIIGSTDTHTDTDTHSNAVVSSSSSSSASSLSMPTSMSMSKPISTHHNQSKSKMKMKLKLELNEEISINELKNAKKSILEAKRHKLSSLRPVDKSKYTVRINTWRRNDQLIASVNHLLTCPGVAQIQIIWCDNNADANADADASTTKPPAEIIKLTTGEDPIVVIEYHSVNSLNERFNVLSKTPTYGILSIDDDVLRPCEAMDDGFFRWTDHPDRIVGYDHRMHIVTNGGAGTNSGTNSGTNAGTNAGDSDGSQIRSNIDNSGAESSFGTTIAGANTNNARTDTNAIWSYGYLSSTTKHNQYSMVLPRFCFLHVDYLSLYMTYMPTRILQSIDQNFNCEDIAMSFFVSSLTDSKVPLLANHWSMRTLVKLSSPGAISQTVDHKALRDKCVDDFGYLLGLKDGYAAITKSNDHESNGSLQGDHNDEEKYTWNKLISQEIWHTKKKSSPFGVGVDVDKHPLFISQDFVPRRKEFIKKVLQWAHGNGSFVHLEKELKSKIRNMGLLSSE
jgi:glucuronyl/N-acetylglucosaminyl transferase EXT2